MITSDGQCGILYEAGNEAALASALNSLKDLNLPELQQRVVAHFNANLSFGAIAKRIQDVVASL
jgi:hypothetical protein